MSRPAPTILALLSGVVAVGFAGPARALPAPEAPGKPGELRFNRDIRPILSDKCYRCHGPDADQRKARLRLDTPSAFISDRDGVAVVVPGDLEASELYARVTAEDAHDRMPPAGSGKDLTDAERALLARWIREGASWEEHWAYVAPVRPALPVVRDESWPRNALDRFILARLESEGITPSLDADPRTLARRLSFDLVGLPTTPRDVEALSAASLDEALPAAVERLLASPHHGERMALRWLDLVRYADTVGYHGDQDRSMSPYRDYVIAAFNANKPFDEFVVEQLAGDLLPAATLEQRIASGYNRLNQITAEGGAQAKEYLAIYAADRVRTTATAFLGSTLGCAQCHDHKFDPFTTRDFYSFAAFFADLEERGVYDGANRDGNWGPSVAVPTAAQAAELARLDGALAGLRATLDSSTPALEAAQRAWEAAVRGGGDGALSEHDWVDDEPPAGAVRQGGWNFVHADAGPVLSGASSRRQQGAELVQHFFQDARRALRPGAADRFYAYVWLEPERAPETLMLQLHAGGWEHRAYWGADRIPFGGIGAEAPAHHRVGALPEPGAWARLEVSAEALGLAPGTPVDGMAFTQFGGLVYWDRAGLATHDPLASVSGLPDELRAALDQAPAARSPEQRTRLAAFFRELAPALDGARAEFANTEAARAELASRVATSLVSASIAAREVRILPRGNWLDDTGEVVLPAVPAFLPQPVASGAERLTRLDLARWIASAGNPLTARVLVNRLWQLCFGRGLVRSLDDLGSQAPSPDHPELLDWLAVELVESGWDVRHVLRLIVTSRAYRQASTARPELEARDPYNALFARQSRLRLEAELIRDNALAVSDLLDRRVGGPSVKPYQPEGYWAQLNFPLRTWQRDTDRDGLRRGLYTYWCRTYLHPSLAAFDAVTREECAAERPRSNTPQQALVLLNDPTYVEAARVLAQRMLEEGGESDAGRLARGFERVLCRAPRDDERAVLLELLAQHRAQLEADPSAGSALIRTGDRPVAERLEPVELAAWTSIARVLLNLHETITRT